MTDETRRLIGEYAAGALNEEEKRRLFEAALEDQELFDQLAGEHALKELLDQPGVKPRIAAALGAGKRAARWKHPAWWLGAAAMVAIVVVSWSVWRAPKPVEIARVSIPPAAVEEPKAAPAPAATPVPTRPPKRPAVRRLAPSPSPAPKDMPAPAPNASATGSLSRLRPQAQPMAPATESARALAAAPPPAPAGISFDYAITGTTLHLRFLTAGYVSIGFSKGDQAVTNEAVAALAIRDLPIPDGATEAQITFAAAADTSSGGVSFDRDSSPGRVNDPGGTRIVLRLKLR